MNQITLSIDNLADSIAPLHHRYPGQIEPQPAYVEIDEDGEVSADYSGEIGNAVPMHVWHGRTLRVSVPSMIRGNALADYLGDAETLDLLERIHAGHNVEWDGSNHVGALTDDARAALKALERDLEQMQFDESSMASVWTADEWLWSNCDLRQNWPDDQTIDAAVSAAEISVLGDGIVISGDFRESLLDRAEADYDRGLPLGGNHIAALIASDRVTTAGATVRFTSTGAEKFSAWFSRVAKPSVNAEVVSAEALDQLDDRLTLDEDLVYELGHAFTASGRPELIKFAGADIEIQVAE